MTSVPDCVRLLMLLANSTTYQRMTASHHMQVSSLKEINHTTIQPDPTAIAGNHSMIATSGEDALGAFIFIAVVISFYAFGIVFMMIRYMVNDSEEQYDELLYKKYVERTRDQLALGMSRGKITNRLALQTLNMANALPQTARDGPKVTFV